ncbi:MAG: hypothetical protein ABI402_20260 [Ferruginibacter sp.]
MKLIIILSFLFFNLLLVKADCGGTPNYCWPDGKTLNKNPVIILSLGDTDLAISLNTKYVMYLKSKQRIIQIDIIQICTGGLNMIQLVLKPKTELVSGETYGLFYRNSKKLFKQITKWDSKSQDIVYIEWKVNNVTDSDLPIWKKEPSIVSKFHQENGCGPDDWLYFDLSFVENSDVVLKAIIKNILTGTAIICYITQREGKFQLGHNMCFGDCNFGEEKEYEVVFYLFDESGNLSKASKAIKFTKPEMEGWSN